MKHLVDFEQEALSLQNKGHFKEAAVLFKKIVDEYPNYEFGLCFYSLAYCLENLGELEEARRYYLKAIQYDGEDIHRLGGYASFLYLHGELSEAFKYYIKLIEVEKKLGFDTSDTIIVLKSLSKKIGLTENEVIEMINKL